MTLKIDTNQIWAPVAIYDMSEADYFAHPALSASGAKRILPPGCPALFEWEAVHGRPDKPQFDFGHAAHTVNLGTGQPIRRTYADLDAQRAANDKALAAWRKTHDFDEGFEPTPLVAHADSWRTTYAKTQQEQARADGATPLLVDDYRHVLDMAKALRRHPIVGQLFQRGRGRPEVSLFWHDDTYGIDRKARLDWWPVPDGAAVPTALIVPDYKSAVSVEPDAFANSAGRYGYHQQAAWYMDAVEAVFGVDAAFVFVAQEKTPPYLITVCEYGPEDIRIARKKNADAMSVFAECAATGIWPPYATDIVPITLPRWTDRQYAD